MNRSTIRTEVFSLFLLTTYDQRSRLAAFTPVTSPCDQSLFYRYLTRVKTYFEFGSGGSTAQAALRVSKIISVESDARWHAHLRHLIGSAADVTSYTLDLKVPSGGWETPVISIRLMTI
jgi:hypothetical protein